MPLQFMFNVGSIQLTPKQFNFHARAFYYFNYGGYTTSYYMDTTYLRWLFERGIRIQFEYFNRG